MAEKQEKEEQKDKKIESYGQGNLFTGGMNFHGKFEYCSLTTMHKTEQVILNLAQLWAE